MANGSFKGYYVDESNIYEAILAPDDDEAKIISIAGSWGSLKPIWAGKFTWFVTKDMAAVRVLDNIDRELRLLERGIENLTREKLSTKDLETMVGALKFKRNSITENGPIITRFNNGH